MGGGICQSKCAFAQGNPLSRFLGLPRLYGCPCVLSIGSTTPRPGANSPGPTNFGSGTSSRSLVWPPFAPYRCCTLALAPSPATRAVRLAAQAQAQAQADQRISARSQPGKPAVAAASTGYPQTLTLATGYSTLHSARCHRLCNPVRSGQSPAHFSRRVTTL